MSNKYPTTDYTFQALKNLGAENRFVNFNSIFNEVKNIRLSKRLMAENKNTRGRVRRSLVYNKRTASLRNTVQGNKLSISIKYPNYIVKSREEISLKDNGLINSSSEVENNGFMLMKK